MKTDKLDLTNVFCDEEGRLPLEDAKRLVLKNLRILEVIPIDIYFRAYTLAF